MRSRLRACVASLSRARIGRGGRIIFDRTVQATPAHTVLSAGRGLVVLPVGFPTSVGRRVKVDRLRLARIYDASDSEDEDLKPPTAAVKFEIPV